MDYSIILVILSFENKIIIVKYIFHFDEIIDRLSFQGNTLMFLNVLCNNTCSIQNYNYS